MKRIAAIAALAVIAAASDAKTGDGPVTINVVVDRECRVTIEPGRLDFKSEFPAAQVVYKKAADPKLKTQSCEVDVPKEAFLERFQFCALSAITDGNGGVYYNYAGGRLVELSVVSGPGADGALAAFACAKR